jgi:two-component system response regulator FixJ
MDVYIVDDEAAFQTVVRRMLEADGHKVTAFHSGMEFIARAADLPPGLVLLDLCMPDLHGLSVQTRLSEAQSLHVIAMLTGFGDVPEAVSAMRAGALDFLTKPVRRLALLEAVERAGQRLEELQQERETMGRIADLDKLSPREKEVLQASARGAGSKQVAYQLNLSVRTVEMHRTNIRKKLNVPNFGAALVLAQSGGLLQL